MDLCEFKASLVYRVSFRITRATQRNPVLKNRGKEKKKELKGRWTRTQAADLDC